MEKEKVDVLLAAYNGSHYVQEQVESILNQSYPHLHLWIRDDGSQDDTREILQHLSHVHPDKITILPSEKNLGIKGNFCELMSHSKAKYIFFSDQDDVWLTHKIEHSLELMHQMEKQHGSETPLLVHSDLKVVNTALQEVSYSFWKYAHLNPKASTLNRILTQNNITGCTMLINRPLLLRALPIPEEALMHDWWIAIVAAAYGHIDYLPTATVYYRQHLANDLGAKPYSLRNYLKRTRCKKRDFTYRKTYLQAETFLHRYRDTLDPNSKHLINAYAALKDASYLRHKKDLITFKFFKSGFLRNLRHLLLTH